MTSLNQVFRDKYYLTDGGLETTLIFHNNIPLQYFAAFDLVKTEKGRKVLNEYFAPYLSLAEKFDLGFVIGAPTWRASADWGFKLGYTHDELFALNKQNIKFMRELAESSSLSQVIVSGIIGPRGDGYRTDFLMTAEQARVYHLDQIKAFAMADADVVTAATINYSDEAIGIVNAARAFGMAVAISFTVEKDGRLPNGETLREAIEKVDSETEFYTGYYMVNCAHPEHFMSEFEEEGDWKSRIGGIRANASQKSHAELDESVILDEGDKCLLAEGYEKLMKLLPSFRLIGGCCGTDHSHLEEICNHVLAVKA